MPLVVTDFDDPTQAERKKTREASNRADESGGAVARDARNDICGGGPCSSRGKSAPPNERLPSRSTIGAKQTQ